MGSLAHDTLPSQFPVHYTEKAKANAMEGNDKETSHPVWLHENSLDRQYHIFGDIQKPDCLVRLKDKLRKIFYLDGKTMFFEGSNGYHVLMLAKNRLTEIGKKREALELCLWAYELASLRQLVCLFSHSQTLPTEKDVTSARIHKGHLLFELADCAETLGWHWLSRRYLLLTIIEDFFSYFFLRSSPMILDLEEKGKYRPIVNKAWAEKTIEAGENSFKPQFKKYLEEAGSHQMATRQFAKNRHDLLQIIAEIAQGILGYTECLKQEELPDKKNKKEELPDKLFPLLGRSTNRYACWPDSAILFPEWALGRLKLERLFPVLPALGEIHHYFENSAYVYYLLRMLYSSSTSNVANSMANKSHFFEEVMRYLLSEVPGFLVEANKDGLYGEFDVLGKIEGNIPDFRDTLGRSILCECKWTQESLDVSKTNGFIANLSNTNTNTGILFVRNGVSGKTIKEEQIYSKAAIEAAKHHSKKLVMVFDEAGLFLKELNDYGQKICVNSLKLATFLKSSDSDRFDVGNDEELLKTFVFCDTRKLNFLHLLEKAYEDARFRFRDTVKK